MRTSGTNMVAEEPSSLTVRSPSRRNGPHDGCILATLLRMPNGAADPHRSLTLTAPPPTPPIPPQNRSPAMFTSNPADAGRGLIWAGLVDTPAALLRR